LRKHSYLGLEALILLPNRCHLGPVCHFTEALQVSDLLRTVHTQASSSGAPSRGAPVHTCTAATKPLSITPNHPVELPFEVPRSAGLGRPKSCGDLWLQARHPAQPIIHIEMTAGRTPRPTAIAATPLRSTGFVVQALPCPLSLVGACSGFSIAAYSFHSSSVWPVV
jgi:hypothetical protein